MSFLEGVAETRKQLVAGMLETIEVPGWDKAGITVKVTYKPADKLAIRKINKASEKKNAEASEKADLQFHVDTAVSIEMSKDGESTTFQGFGDSDLGDVLGVEGVQSAQTNVSSLFLKDGDMTRYAKVILNWSGYRDESADEALLGE